MQKYHIYTVYTIKFMLHYFEDKTYFEANAAYLRTK